MTPLRALLLVMAAAALLAAMAGCTSPLAPELRQDSGSSALAQPSAAGRVRVDDSRSRRTRDLVGELDGEVRRGPSSAMYEDGVDTSKPFPGVTVEIRTEAGVLVTKVVSDENGLFSIVLPIGYYNLRPIWPATTIYRPLQPPPDRGVTIYQGGIAAVMLFYQTNYY